MPGGLFKNDNFHNPRRESREYKSSDPRDKVFALLAHPSAYEEVSPETYGQKDHLGQAGVNKENAVESMEEKAKALFELVQE